MTLRQRRDLPSLLDRKSSRPIRALQILKAINRDATGARRELQESGLLLGVPGADDLPEILDHLVLFLVAAVVGVFLPVVDVDIRDTADQELELAFVEDVDEVGGDELVEARDEGAELLFHALLDLPFCEESRGC